MRWNTFDRLIRQGSGQGHLDAYIPFRQNTRRNISMCNNQAIATMPGYRRSSHFENRHQRSVGLLALWAGARDVREKYPLWPFTHPHPLSDWPMNFEDRPCCVGSAEALGSLTGCSFKDLFDSAGLSIPLTDLMLTVGDPHCPRCVMVACFPIQRTLKAPPRRDNLPSLEIGLQYAAANGFAHRIIDTAMIGKTLLRNLKAFSFSVNVVRETEKEHDVTPLVESLKEALERGESISEAVKVVSSRQRIPECVVWPVFDFMAWTQVIDIDLSAQVRHSEPIVPGGHQLRSAVQDLLFSDRT
ncbi:hypothetical protein PQQ86_24985 [Paraburkholderia sediminicola]|uniref:hypothetical protein n=1 Tax=Paraburkholderia sediminicola TaxID=458836 RepID=UPI0038BD3A94